MSLGLPDAENLQSLFMIKLIGSNEIASLKSLPFLFSILLYLGRALQQEDLLLIGDYFLIRRMSLHIYIYPVL